MAKSRLVSQLIIIVVTIALFAIAIGAVGHLANIKWVWLWTDLLVFALVGTILLFGKFASRRPHLLEPWRQVLRSRMGMASLVILLCYVVIGLSDSVHFRNAITPNATNEGSETHYSGEVLSLLDLALSTLKNSGEKTYSAPLAYSQFSKETIEEKGGGKSRDFPRLKFGGAHLENPEQEWQSDIIKRATLGIFLGLIVSLGIAFVIILFLARRWNVPVKKTVKRIRCGDTTVPWSIIILTTSVVAVVAGVVAALAHGYHVFGTDKVGEDVLYQSLKSIRTGLLIGTLTTLIMLPFAIMLGIMAGYFKGWIDDVIQYIYTTLNSIPGVLLIAAAVLMLQVYLANHPDMFETDVEKADMRLFFLCLILGITSWTGLCRLLRGETLKLGEMDYVLAARAFGANHFAIVFKHILPNVLHVVLITVVLDFSGLVLAEAVLSYVGVGVDPTMQSWGNMINGARLEMAREPIVWWSLAAAFIFMFVLVLAANLFSDVVRDAFDPRIRKN